MNARRTPPVRLLSVVIPARDEAGCIQATVEALYQELSRQGIAHEIVVVDDGSRDQTWRLLEALRDSVSTLTPVPSPGPNGFGRAVRFGLSRCTGDAVVIMMADGSDDPGDVVRYWKTLNEGWECVFGSRFIKGGRVIGYPRFKLVLNRASNLFIRILFGLRLNDTTNAFKAYRRTVIEGCQPLIAPHFNLTVELPLKSIIRGYSYTIIPITWRSRRTGTSQLRIKEMGSRYFFICMYCWLEKYFSRGDYLKESEESEAQSPDRPR